MYKELTLFDGGINNLIATHLISENQSQFIQNAKINSGVIMSQREKVETSRVVNGKYGFYYRAKDQVITSDEDRFFVEWGGSWRGLIETGKSTFVDDPHFERQV